MLVSACASPPKPQTADIIGKEEVSVAVSASPMPSPSSEAEELLQACDAALTDCEQANRDKIKVIDKQMDIIKEQTNQMEAAKKEQAMFYNHPIFYFVLGILLMAVGFGIAN